MKTVTINFELADDADVVRFATDLENSLIWYPGYDTMEVVNEA